MINEIYGGMIVSYITMEIWTGIWILVRLLPTALIIFTGVMIIELGIEFIQKKKIEIRILNCLCQFLWILIIVSILKITGIIGGSFGISSPLDSYIRYATLFHYYGNHYKSAVEMFFGSGLCNRALRTSYSLEIVRNESYGLLY